MAFTMHKATSDTFIGRFLTENNLPYIDVGQVERHQNKTKAAEFNVHDQEFKKDHPLKHLFIEEREGALICLFTVFIVVLVLICFLLKIGIIWKVISSIVAGISCYFLGNKILETGINWIEPATPWMVYPVSIFKGEYPSEIQKILDILPCSPGHCENPLIKAMVKHHPYSRIRFLVLESFPYHDTSYYVAFWKSPQEEKAFVDLAQVDLTTEVGL